MDKGVGDILATIKPAVEALADLRVPLGADDVRRQRCAIDERLDKNIHARIVQRQTAVADEALLANKVPRDFVAERALRNKAAGLKSEIDELAAQKILLCDVQEFLTRLTTTRSLAAAVAKNLNGVQPKGKQSV
jgi:hypothetical protein